MECNAARDFLSTGMDLFYKVITSFFICFGNLKTMLMLRIHVFVFLSVY
jgi:hypothetical protein